MPRNYLPIILTAVFLSPCLLWANETSKQSVNPLLGLSGKGLKDSVADVVETDEETSAESLNRISGKVDTGYASPDKTYDSPNHHPPGALGHEKAMEKKYSKSD